MKRIGAIKRNKLIRFKHFEKKNAFCDLYQGVEIGESNKCEKKREDKVRRWDLKSVDNVDKEVSGIKETDKLNTPLSKYSELYEEYHRQCQRRDVQPPKERGNLVLAVPRAVLIEQTHKSKGSQI